MFSEFIFPYLVYSPPYFSYFHSVYFRAVYCEYYRRTRAKPESVIRDPHFPQVHAHALSIWILSLFSLYPYHLLLT